MSPLTQHAPRRRGRSSQTTERDPHQPSSTLRLLPRAAPRPRRRLDPPGPRWFGRSLNRSLRSGDLARISSIGSLSGWIMAALPPIQQVRGRSRRELPARTSRPSPVRGGRPGWSRRRRPRGAGGFPRPPGSRSAPGESPSAPPWTASRASAESSTCERPLPAAASCMPSDSGWSP